MPEAPFPVRWAPVVSLVELGPEIKAQPLKDTLKRKELARCLLMSDLVARLEPTSPLVEEMRPAQEEHITAGGTYETFV